jgi:hypothetical protein
MKCGAYFTGGVFSIPSRRRRNKLAVADKPGIEKENNPYNHVDPACPVKYEVHLTGV